MSSIDPNHLFETLKAGARPQKQQNLEIMHQVCAQLHRLGSKDFSLATVGRMSEERGGMSRRALYNTTSDDFKALIRAWAESATDKTPKTKLRESLPSDNELLKKIADPALRALLGGIIAERDRLRSEVKVLKSNANVVIDKRVLPGHVNITPKGQVVQIVGGAGLSDTEKEALAQAISPEFLRQEGWEEGENGEILNTRGRRLFAIGFANAIRKLLMS
ncbi:MAG: alpha/beta hydrolase [Nitrosomonadales bacterium]|nr:alpha/beta hydrolase [Nitrosomonadales bacterium]